MQAPDDRRYSPDHLWLHEDGRIGITHRLAEWLPELTAVHLPPVGHAVFVAQGFGALESHKGTFELYAPCDGRVVRFNPAVVAEPRRVRDDPYGEGWLLWLEPEGVPPPLSAERYEREQGFQFPAFRRSPRS